MRLSQPTRRITVFVLVVIVVFAAALAGGVALWSGGNAVDTAEPARYQEYDVDSLVAEPVARTDGPTPTVAPAHRGGKVLIDVGHGNDLQRSQISPLLEQLIAANHTIRLHRSGDNLTEQLDDAAAFVSITPASQYSPEEVDAVTAFTDRGGRMVLVAEPDRYEVSLLSVEKRSDAVTTLASSYGISFETRYLYNLHRNDGNFRNVFARPGPNASIDGLERTVMHTATAVTARSGTDVLVTTEGTRLSDGGQAGHYPVAVRTGNVLAMGDRSSLSAARHTVADNDAMLAHVVEFLARGTDG